MAHPRLERLPERDLNGVRLFEAARSRDRLLGLAGLRELEPGHALLLRRCRAVHTFGMRFTLDIVFLDAAGRPALVVRRLPPRRLAACVRARAVIEIGAGEAARVLAAIGDLDLDRAD